MDPSLAAASTTTFSAAATSPAGSHLGLPQGTSLSPTSSHALDVSVSADASASNLSLVSFPLGTVVSNPPPIPTRAFPPPDASSGVNASSSRPSYAEATGSMPAFHRPAVVKKYFSTTYRIPLDNGVSIRASAVQGTSIDNYIGALVAQGIPVGQLTDISRIGSTIQAYFKDKSWATQLVHTGLDLGDEFLEVLPVGTAPRSVTVSDVPPWVTDATLKQVLSNFGIVQGAIRTLPVSSSYPGVGFLRSSRRVADVVFASHDAFQNLPKVFHIEINDRPVALRFNVPLKCHACGQLGHAAKACPRAKPAEPMDALEPTSADRLPSDAGVAGNGADPLIATDPAASGTLSPRRKRFLRPPAPQPPPKRLITGMSPPASLTPPPRGPSRYQFDAVSGAWKDLKGLFTPVIDHAKVCSFIADAVTLPASAAVSLARSLAPDDLSLVTLSRQVMVIAYTDASIAGLSTMAAKKNARHHYYKVARVIRESVGPASESDVSDSAMQ